LYSKVSLMCTWHLLFIEYDVVKRNIVLQYRSYQSRDTLIKP